MVFEDSDQKVLTDLKRKRGVIKASLTRARNFVNSFNPREQAITLVEFRQEELPQISRRFDEIQCEIELIDVDNFEETEQAREAFENDYYAVRSEMQEMINQEKSHNSSLNNNSLNASASHSQQPRLPPIEIPKFDGNIQEWNSFFDLYKAMVHDNEHYSLAQKFSYLQLALGGPASDLIKGIPITEVNYEV